MTWWLHLILWGSILLQVVLIFFAVTKDKPSLFLFGLVVFLSGIFVVAGLGGETVTIPESHTLPVEVGSRDTLDVLMDREGNPLQRCDDMGGDFRIDDGIYVCGDVDH